MEQSTIHKACPFLLYDLVYYLSVMLFAVIFLKYGVTVMKTKWIGIRTQTS